ncbi:tRNA-guanine transglycosylase, partial [candidate division KSB1 bacterium]|nr:tRNA-guanine transglycosylase [candidate division KSB1 bacterium]
ENKPRYLMGMGKPEDLVEAVSLGIDMFDCVIPTRNGRKGQLFTWSGTINVRNAAYKEDFLPVDETCKCYTCLNFSRAYLRHLFHSAELLGLRLGSLHNLYFYHQLTQQMRQSIESNNFNSWKQDFLNHYKSSSEVNKEEN